MTFFTVKKYTKAFVVGENGKKLTVGKTTKYVENSWKLHKGNSLKSAY
jgi:hypothetical protein